MPLHMPRVSADDCMLVVHRKSMYVVPCHILQDAGIKHGETISDSTFNLIAERCTTLVEVENILEDIARKEGKKRYGDYEA